MLPLDKQTNRDDGGDMTECFTELYSSVWQELYRYALHYLGNREDAEDAVQETAIEAYKGMGGLKDVSAFKSWIFVILVRQCKKRISDTIRKRQNVDISDVEYQLEDKNDEYGSFEDAQTVIKALDTLSPENREVMMLSVISNLPSNDIAQILGVPPSTVRSRITRSLKYLKKALPGATKNGLF